jgi:hypothetical protein
MQTTRIRSGFLLCLGLVLGAGFAALPASAQNVWDTVPSMDVVRSRLELTIEQEARLLPIFERRVAELQKVRDQLAQATSDQEKRTVLRDAKQGADAFNSQVEGVLDASQKSEWQEMRAETREKVKDRYEQNKESQ